MRQDFQNLRRELDQLQRMLKDTAISPSREDLLALTRVLARLLREMEESAQAVIRRHEDLDDRLLKLENSRFIRTLQWPGRVLLDWKGRLGQFLLHSPLHPLYLRLVHPQAATAKYQLWVEQEQSAASSYPIKLEGFTRRPRISVILPVHQPPRREWLVAALESVLGQVYPCWELCICDDSSSDPWVAEYLGQMAASEPRIRLTRSTRRLGISEASNQAGELARGEYAAFLDQDDALSPHALSHVANAVQYQDADLIYSDEDRLDGEGRRVQPIFKPAWSPDLLLCGMYMGHLLVARKECLDRVGWLRGAFDGSQDYDLVLRLTDTSGVVRHIPRILYHWRMHPESTAATLAAKPYSHSAGWRALTDTVARRGWEATVEDGATPNTYRVRRAVSGALRVSLVICSRNARLLRRCLRAVARRTAYRNREIVVVQHRTGNDAAMDHLLARTDCVRVPFSGAFNFSVMNNLAVRQASGDILVFLNDDVEPLDPAWLHELVAHAQRPEIGVVGARLLYPSGAIQHAGLAIGIMNGVSHLHRDTFAARDWNWMGFTRNVSAVTSACMAIRKGLFEELGGFDSAFPMNYNDADLCLRARGAGYQVVYEPAACLRHYESQTRERGIRYEERALWHARWGAVLDGGDLYYSPHLTDVREDASLRIDGGQWGSACFR